jgi:serine/threonine protein kinase
MADKKLLSEGAYGCIYIPPLMCKEKTTRTKMATLSAQQPMLSKLQKEEHTQEELESVKEIRKIPLASHYFLLPEPEQCHPNVREEPLIKQSCDVTKGEAFRDLTMIQIPYGGKSLRAVELDMRTFSFRAFMIHLLEGASLLSKSGWAHADLHDGNVLVGQVATSPRIIDFGKLIRFTEKDPEEIRKRFLVFEPGYEHIPPECLWFSGLHKTSYAPAQILERIPNMKDSLNQLINFASYSREQQAQDLREFMNKYMTENKQQATDLATFWHVIGPKFDSWSIGVLFIYMLRNFLHVPAFVQGEYAGAKRVLLYVIHGLCNLNPYKRLLPEEALRVLKASVRQGGATTAATPRSKLI